MQAGEEMILLPVKFFTTCASCMINKSFLVFDNESLKKKPPEKGGQVPNVSPTASLRQNVLQNALHIPFGQIDRVVIHPSCGERMVDNVGNILFPDAE